MAYNPGQELSSLAFDKIIGGALNAVIEAQKNSSIATVNFVRDVGFYSNNGKLEKPIYVDFKYPKELAPYQPATEASCTFEIRSGGEGYTKEAITGCTVGDKSADLEFTVDNGQIVGIEAKTVDPEWKNGSKIKITASGEDIREADIVCRVTAAREAQPAVFQEMTLQVPILTMLPIPFIRVATTDIEFNVKINSIEQNSKSSDTNMASSLSATASGGFFGMKYSCTLNASMSNQKKSSSTEEIKKEYSLNIKIHAVQDETPVGMSRLLDILEESIVPRSGAVSQA